ncbi:MAG: imidazole glycerol phosphate synthase subunit HisH [Promethearchaeota archaeon]|nr:MAG: imidazole glycerol phosphate synthase subunit HisH [Candidatus Lokiarchaeota archaeon]
MGFNIAIIDYEMGNLKSIFKCLKHINANAVITDEPRKILDADGIILPGVGAFGDAMRILREKQLIPVIKQIVQEKKPLFGICLGLQLLFSKSFEMGEHEGLDLVNGKVILFDIDKVEKVPQIGWNSVKFLNTSHYLVQDIPDESFYYFVHSYFAIPTNKENILGLTTYGEIDYCSIVNKENIIATQFHPEKSSKHGIKMYENFVHHCRK